MDAGPFQFSQPHQTSHFPGRDRVCICVYRTGREDGLAGLDLQTEPTPLPCPPGLRLALRRRLGAGAFSHRTGKPFWN